MSWAEIKKAVNSDLSVPLNELHCNILKGFANYSTSNSSTVPIGLSVDGKCIIHSIYASSYGTYGRIILTVDGSAVVNLSSPNVSYAITRRLYLVDTDKLLGYSSQSIHYMTSTYNTTNSLAVPGAHSVSTSNSNNKQRIINEIPFVDTSSDGEVTPVLLTKGGILCDEGFNIEVISSGNSSYSPSKEILVLYSLLD